MVANNDVPISVNLEARDMASGAGGGRLKGSPASGGLWDLLVEGFLRVIGAVVMRLCSKSRCSLGILQVEPERAPERSQQQRNEMTRGHESLARPPSPREAPNRELLH